MSSAAALLQYGLAGVLVAACALYSLWRLAPASLRLRMVAALARVPGAARAPWFGRLQARTVEKLAAGCGGCAAAKPGAPARNQTPGALRR